MIAITNVTITATSDSILSGTMNLEYHGVPKINDADREYLKWTLKNTYGKEDLFSSGAASGVYSIIEEKEEDAEPFDEKMTRLTTELGQMFEQSHKLEEEIKQNLAGIGWKI